MKNKKLLALFALPLIICIMVLPLCSFTTTQNTKCLYYQSNNRVDLGYTYFNNSGVGYYGIIPNILSCSLEPNSVLSSVKSSIKFTACNYVMASGHEIEYKSFGSSRNPSILTSYNYDTRSSAIDFSLESDDPSRTFFNSVIIRGYSSENYSIELFDGTYTSFDDSYTITGLAVWGSGVLYVDEGNNGQFVAHNYSYFIDYGLNDKTIYTYEIYLSIIDELGIDERDFIIIPNFTINFRVYTVGDYEDVDFRNLIGGIRIGGTLYEVGDNISSLYGYQYFDDYYNNGYQEGYSHGLNVGLSTAEDVWGDVLDFLSTTTDTFLDFEFVENISFGSIFAVFISIGLLIAFLKIFAGG